MEKRGPIEAGRVPFAGIPDKWKAWMGGWFGDGWGSRDQFADVLRHLSAGLARQLLESAKRRSWVFPFWGSLAC